MASSIFAFVSSDVKHPLGIKYFKLVLALTKGGKSNRLKTHKEVLLGQQMVNLTIWISLVFYLAAVAVLFLVVDDRKQYKTYRILWSLGCIFSLIHVFCAFHFVHDWDHQAAVKHTIIETERVIGLRFEYGIYFNYLFLLVWTIDCFVKEPNIWWSRLVHIYMLIIIISATVVFEDGLIRYIALAVLAILALVYYRYRSE